MIASNILLTMWSTGELKREFRHVGGKEAMVIRRPLHKNSHPVVILLENMHIYYPLDEAEFIERSPVYTALAIGHLGLPEGFSGSDLRTTLRRFVDYVQDGFDELKKMKPEDRKKEVVGEFEAHLNGERISGEITE